jgi:hypothetical protein
MLLRQALQDLTRRQELWGAGTFLPTPQVRHGNSFGVLRPT